MAASCSFSGLLERVEQGDEEADALEVGATGDALVGAVDAAVAFVIVDHKGREADALVADVYKRQPLRHERKTTPPPRPPLPRRHTRR